jgi:hypothetical protein
MFRSAVSSVGMPPIVGESSPFIQLPPTTLVSQLPNGALDLLELDQNSGQLVASDLVPGTAGLPSAMGVGQAQGGGPMFNGVTGNFDVVTQLADGSIDLIGISGNFPSGTATYASSYLIPSSAGFSPIGDVNPNYFNNSDSGAGTSLITTLPNGQFDALYFNSGYNDAAHEGMLFASNLFNVTMPGWRLVDSSFPLS